MVVTPTYTILEGTDQTYIIGSGVDVEIKASGNESDLTDINVDGTVLDISNHEKANGSTILKLYSSYLETLAEGNHTVTFMYGDGNVGTNLLL